MVTGKLSNRSLKTKDFNLRTRIKIFRTQSRIHPAAFFSVGEDSQPDTFVRSFSTNFTALEGKALTFGNILSPKNKNNCREEILKKRMRFTTFWVKEEFVAKSVPFSHSLYPFVDALRRALRTFQKDGAKRKD